MLDSERIIEMLKNKYLANRIDVKGGYITDVFYIKHQFLCYKRDFVVVFSSAKYTTQEESKKLISDLSFLDDFMPKQNNSHDCIYICECNDFPNDDISIYGREWHTHFLIAKDNLIKFEKDFWFGGAGKIKKCGEDIAKTIANQ